MSHRNSKPKPSASERTQFRWRVRHDEETESDKTRMSLTDQIRNYWYSMRHPEEEKQ